MKTIPDNVEVWLRGPVPDIPAMLQPVAHALLQAQEEVTVLCFGLNDEALWKRPAGLASPAFHLQHLTGVLDRLFTYARAEGLSPEQLNYLEAEGKRTSEITTASLLTLFNLQMEKAMSQLTTTPENKLLEAREVGRQKLLSTTLGLLFHAAEHTQRHVGQLLVTVRVIRNHIN